MKPFFVAHPWEILKDELIERGLTQKKFSEIIGKSPSELSEILNGKRNITASWALSIGVALGTSADFWFGLQKDYELFVVGKRTSKTQLDKVRARYDDYVRELNHVS